LYGPYRDIAESAPLFGDRSSYQISPSNLEEAMREIQLDIQEGADLVMVKPAMYHLDVVREASNRFKLPVAVFSVGAEYFMIKELVKSRLADEKDIVIEVLKSIKRAGAGMVITYFAKDVARWFREMSA
jgi:porphobilinogen synthase